MKQPIITDQIGGYILEWEDIALLITVKRLDVHSDGRVTGDIEIKNSSKEHPVILLPYTQFNFSAERTRSQTAKQLKEKYPDSEIEWIELFDYLGYKIQDLAHLGSPVSEVWPDDEIQVPEYLIKPYIIRGVSNIIYGEKGVNKSTLVYLMGMSMMIPEWENPLGFETLTRPVKCLVLDWETEEYIFKYYLSRLSKGMGIPKCPLYYRHCNLPLSEEVEAIESYIKETGAEVLIIDSLAAAAGGEQGELKGSQSALQFNSAIRKLGKTTLIIAQTAKNQETNKKTIYGSVIFTYYARNIFELCRGDNEDTDTIHLGLFHRECNLGKKYPPAGFCLEFNDASKAISITSEPLRIDEFISKVTTQSRILDLLKRGALSTKEMADTLEMKVPSVTVIINRLRQKSKVVKVGEKWGLSVL
jgi:hypothetical protein